MFPTVNRESVLRVGRHTSRGSVLQASPCTSPSSASRSGLEVFLIELSMNLREVFTMPGEGPF